MWPPSLTLFILLFYVGKKKKNIMLLQETSKQNNYNTLKNDQEMAHNKNLCPPFCSLLRTLNCISICTLLTCKHFRIQKKKKKTKVRKKKLLVWEVKASFFLHESRKRLSKLQKIQRLHVIALFFSALNPIESFEREPVFFSEIRPTWSHQVLIFRITAHLIFFREVLFKR